ncbi:DUF805 domain-containing protein [Asticcacaulis excentricus]|uniref:DUF805 domain-containing protein n=1 Tax=Asticcacaulis excentricus (strain ATCC 15261 / DSM 4724 / KCTC 12464 / NCIMB 9791 / VKM B-1370 / CB 48) TaxID=573065 RepID=E8RN17_ASTEC|nr:DUF805 domain-containing protein [Asticcacaulis excentricus]ADU12850.1 protein of unknown function DUF805 [Asticcacaulis excentricus CB 48]
MGSLSIWHWVILGLLALPAFLPLIITRPSLPNRYAKYKPAPKGFFEAVAVCFKKYADFNGRASRSEYWWYTLFVFLISVALGFFETASNIQIPTAFNLIWGIPHLAVASRRLHDINRSGWWQLIGYSLGIVPLIYMLCQPSVGEDRNVAEVFD